MSTSVGRWVRRAGVAGLLVAVGASIAAMNWYNTWVTFAHLDAGSDPARVSLTTVESQANFLRWVLVALVSLVVAVVAMASERWAGDATASGARRHLAAATDR